MSRLARPSLCKQTQVDEAKAHYLWMNLGWQNGDRITGMTVYVRIRDGKFWIEFDRQILQRYGEMISAEHSVLSFTIQNR